MIFPFLSFDVLLKAGLLIGGIIWCYEIIKRLPHDISELRESYRKYKTRNAPESTENMKEEQRNRYQDDCTKEFWATFAIQALLLWPVTVAVLFYVIIFTFLGIIRPILQLF